MCITVIPVGLLLSYATAPGPVRLPCAEATIEEMLKRLAIPSELVAIALVNGLQRPKSHRLVAGDVVKLVPLMKAVPFPGFVDWLGGALGMHGSMDSWKGRS